MSEWTKCTPTEAQAAGAAELAVQQLIWASERLGESVSGDYGLWEGAVLHQQHGVLLLGKWCYQVRDGEWHKEPRE